MTVSADAPRTRKQRNRDDRARFRKRRKYGLRTASTLLSPMERQKLRDRGYLHGDSRLDLDDALSALVADALGEQ